MRIRSIKPEFWRSDDITSLPITARLTFIGMWSYVDDNGVGNARVSSIIGDLYAEDMARDPQETLKRVSGDLQQLESKGLLIKYRDPHHPSRELYYVTNWESHQVVNRPSKGHEYPLPSPEIVEMSQKTDSTHVKCMSVSGVSQECLSAGAGEQGNRGTGEQGSRSLDQPDGRSRSATPSRFEEFWNHYPRKVGKQKAKTKYETAAKKIDQQIIINGAIRLANDPNLPETQFIPHPTTWLERGGWDDEPLPPRNINNHASKSEAFWEQEMRAARQRDQNSHIKEIGA